MKIIVVLLFLLLIAIALYLGLSVPSVAPLEGLPEPGSTQDVSAPTAKLGAVAAPAPSAVKRAEGAASSTVNDVKQVVDYATGYTPLKIKKNTEKKIRDINAAHNAEMENALDEN